MLVSVIRFVRLPLLLVVIWSIARLSLGLAGVPYAPRGNAMFSIVGLTFISCVYFGALSARVGGFSWKGTILVGIVIGVFAEVLILLLTLVSYLGGMNTYFVHWDALNVPEGATVSMADAMMKRVSGVIFGGTIVPAIVALIGRALGGLAPAPRSTP